MSFRILFVDDEPGVLRSMARLMRRRRTAGQAEFVDNGHAALDALARESFDLVVSDMSMPGMDGVALLGEVRTRWPATARLIRVRPLDGGALARHLAGRAPVPRQALRGRAPRRDLRAPGVSPERRRRSDRGERGDVPALVAGAVRPDDGASRPRPHPGRRHRERARRHRAHRQAPAARQQRVLHALRAGDDRRPRGLDARPRRHPLAPPFDHELPPGRRRGGARRGAVRGRGGTPASGHGSRGGGGHAALLRSAGRLLDGDPSLGNYLLGLWGLPEQLVAG